MSHQLLNNMNQSKTLGYILIGIGAVILLFGVVWALGGSITSAGGRIVAIFFAAIVAAALIGFGIYTLNKGNIESADDTQVKRQQKLLGMVMTQGKVDISNAAIELGVTRDQTKALIYDLIGKQLFSGYVDWNAGMLYSADASLIKNGTCPKCGGKLELAGKGLVKCPYCGSEVFAT
jgi:4-amino-4-deoxy-L-arabinose transferase-like glycosyltransferase